MHYGFGNNNFHVVICILKYEFGSVAQLVEQRPEKPCVGGSIPPRATTPSPSIDAYRGIFYFMDKVHISSGSNMVAQPWSINVITLPKARYILPLSKLCWS